MKMSTSITKIAGALVKAQKEMGAVTKDANNPFYKSKYADINSVLEVAVPALNSNGIFVSQPDYSTVEGHFVETYLMHESGEFLASEPLRLELSKVDMQQLGSAITYGRRYSLQSMLGLRAEDDDGETSMNRTKPAQAKTVVENEPPKADTSFRMPKKPTVNPSF